MNRIIYYLNGIVIKGNENNRIFVETKFDYKPEPNRSVVRLICKRYWDRKLTKKEKKQFVFTRDFFKRTYSVKTISFGKEIFDEMCYAVVTENDESQTFIWEENQKK